MALFCFGQLDSGIGSCEKEAPQCRRFSRQGSAGESAQRAKRKQSVGERESCLGTQREKRPKGSLLLI